MGGRRGGQGGFSGKGRGRPAGPSHRPASDRRRRTACREGQGCRADVPCRAWMGNIVRRRKNHRHGDKRPCGHQERTRMCSCPCAGVGLGPGTGRLTGKQRCRVDLDPTLIGAEDDGERSVRRAGGHDAGAEGCDRQQRKHDRQRCKAAAAAQKGHETRTKHEPSLRTGRRARSMGKSARQGPGRHRGQCAQRRSGGRWTLRPPFLPTLCLALGEMPGSHPLILAPNHVFAGCPAAIRPSSPRQPMPHLFGDGTGHGLPSLRLTGVAPLPHRLPVSRPVPSPANRGLVGAVCSLVKTTTVGTKSGCPLTLGNGSRGIPTRDTEVALMPLQEFRNLRARGAR